MSYLKFIQAKESWEEFLEKEESKDFNDKQLITKLKNFIKHNRHLSITDEYLKNFAFPIVKQISKYNTSKKRTVYVYPGNYMLILKLTSYYILQKYSSVFSPNSLAYVSGRSVKSVFSLMSHYNIKNHDIVYKNDFSDYFNSIPIDRLGPKLKDFLWDDLDLYELIMQLLSEKHVKKNGILIEDEHKGVMAGSPIAGILANIYMHDIDKEMLKHKYKYVRYADDTLIVGKEALDFFKSKIEDLGIKFNPKKMQEMTLATGITFLGFKFIGKKIDISDDAKAKMKSRFKRRAKWYRQWMLRRNVKKEVAIKDYIKKINFKLYSDQDDSINWSRWYLPNINTTESIKYLDSYFIDCIRYLDSGTWTKGKAFYRLQYDDIKALGFKSLINEYYKIKKQRIVH